MFYSTSIGKTTISIITGCVASSVKALFFPFYPHEYHFMPLSRYHIHPTIALWLRKYIIMHNFVSKVPWKTLQVGALDIWCLILSMKEFRLLSRWDLQFE